MESKASGGDQRLAGVVGCRFRHGQVSVVGCRVSVVGCRFFGVCRLWVVGCRLSFGVLGLSVVRGCRFSWFVRILSKFFSNVANDSNGDKREAENPDTWSATPKVHRAVPGTAFSRQREGDTMTTCPPWEQARDIAKEETPVPRGELTHSLLHNIYCLLFLLSRFSDIEPGRIPIQYQLSKLARIVGNNRKLASCEHNLPWKNT